MNVGGKLAVLVLCLAMTVPVSAAERHTSISISGDEFRINGKPTYAGRRWNGHNIQGLLLNSRMVQGIFDDLNANTVLRWAYPDTGKWDAERNTREFIQPWNNSAIAEDGSLRTDYMKRLERIIDRADELGMVVILGYFYFGQDERLRDEAAVIRATDNATEWIFARGYRNVLVEIDNECNVRYEHAILRPERVHELIERVKKITRNGRSLLVTTSYGGGTIPKQNVVRAADFLLIHGNDISDPKGISEMVRKIHVMPSYRGVPILFNEDDHYDFEKPMNNFIAAVREHASWGYFDFRMKNEGFDEGYQSVPVNWSISSVRKRGFFTLVGEITGELK